MKIKNINFLAKANIKAGVDLVNDIWGMKYDKDFKLCRNN